MMDAVERHKKMLQYLKDNHPVDEERNKEDGVQLVWELNRANDPFHAPGLGKTQHNEEQD